MTAAHADMAPRTSVDPDELAEWTAANRRARESYYRDPFAASRLGAKSPSTDPRLASANVTSAEVRAWAREQHMRIASIGVIPHHIVTAYLAAHPEGNTA